ncbi:MAG: hypothetical protein PVF23_04430 [Chromatiales bacterium]|jgi:hypothetical protein
MRRNNEKYGRRLSGQEYDRKIVELHRDTPPMPSAEEDAAIRKLELNLSIDYRLGTAFPEEKREALWKIMQRLEKKRLWLAFKSGLQVLFNPRNHMRKRYKHASGLARYMVDAFAEVLDEDELRQFFELEPGEQPTLPVDRDSFYQK